MQYCSKKSAPNQAECYNELAETFFNMKDFERAWVCFEKSGSKEEGARRIAYAMLGDKNFPANNQQVYHYFERAGMAQQGSKRDGNNHA